MNATVSLSCDSGPDYEFGIVLAAAVWQQFGFGVHAALVGPVSGVVRATLASLGATVRAVRAVPGYPSLYSAKLARFFAAFRLPPDAVMVLSDADMLLLDPGHLSVPIDGEAFAFHGRNLYDGTEWPGRIPVCYMVGPARSFRQVLGGSSLGRYVRAHCHHGEETNGNFSDELMWRDRMGCHPDLLRSARHVNRPRKAPMAPIGRLSHGGWRFGTVPRNLIDGHLPRKAWDPRTWPAVLAVITAYAPRAADCCDAFRRDYVSHMATVPPLSARNRVPLGDLPCPTTQHPSGDKPRRKGDYERHPDGAPSDIRR